MTTPPHPPLERANRVRQAAAILAVLLGAVYLAWRIGWTLDRDHLVLGLPLLAAEVAAFVLLVASIYSTWRLTRRSPGPPPRGIRVATLIATYDEEPEVLRPTVLGALAVRHDGPYEVWVLDDGGRTWVADMCDELGARYRSRPAPRRHAKAGNLNDAIDRIDADAFLTLDADHVPFPQILERTLGYLSDPRVAVVQCPQIFYNRGFQHPSRSDDPLENEQSVFFDVIMRGKDRHGAAIWCGTPAILSRAALIEVGGVATETVTEDAHTALRMQAAGWITVYHHEPLAVGLAPEELPGYLVQRQRWAAGGWQMLRLERPLRRRGLTFRQRLHHLAGCLHGLEGPQRLIGLLIPPAVLTTGLVPYSTGSGTLVLALALPLVLWPLAGWATGHGRFRPIESEIYALARMPAHVRALRSLVRPRRVKFAVTPKGASARGATADGALAIHRTLVVASIAAIAAQLAAQRLDLANRLDPIALAITTAWALLGVALLAATLRRASVSVHRRAGHRFPAAIPAAVREPDDAGALLNAQVTDLSPLGLGLETSRRISAGMNIEIVLLLDEGPVRTFGRAMWCRPAGEREVGDRVEPVFSTGIRFVGLPDATRDLVRRQCFQHPLGRGCGVVAIRQVPAVEERAEAPAARRPE